MMMYFMLFRKTVCLSSVIAVNAPTNSEMMEMRPANFGMPVP